MLQILFNIFNFYGRLTFLKYNKVFVFLFILICFTSIAYSADETFTDVFNDTNNYENIEKYG